MTPTESFDVKIANGKVLQCCGQFEDVKINLQDISLSIFILYHLLGWI